MTDAVAEAELIRLRAGMLAYARRMVACYPAIDGEDLLQAAYLHAWQKRESIRRTEALMAYVRRSVRNALIDTLRSGAWRYSAPMDAGEYAPDCSRRMEKIEARLDAETLISFVRVKQYRNALRMRLRDEAPIRRR